MLVFVRPLKVTRALFLVEEETHLDNISLTTIVTEKNFHNKQNILKMIEDCA